MFYSCHLPVAARGERVRIRRFTLRGKHSSMLGLYTILLLPYCMLNGKTGGVGWKPRLRNTDCKLQEGGGGIKVLNAKNCIDLCTITE